MRRVLVGVVLWLLIGRATVNAEDGRGEEPVAQRWASSFIEENDLIFRTDRHYTQGIKVTLMPPERAWDEKGLMSLIPAWGYEPQFVRVGFGIGQNIYTPADISVPTLLTNDRPYAGYLYFSTMFHRRGMTTYNHAVLESLELELGVVGPWALGGEAQTWVHEIRGFALPQGWSNQLKNEPGIRIKALRAHRWRWEPWAPIGVDLIPHLGVSLGTVENSAQLSGMFRAGLNLPDDFGVRTLDSLTTDSGGYDANWNRNHSWGAYGFISLTAKAVGQNIFLDGNIFHGSHHITKQTVTADAIAGGVLVLRRFELGFVLTIRGKEYAGQTEFDGFGTVYGKVKF
ncbi:MAG TPA: lipid A deacylase LpxR family protein [Verrucomicrobiae bacterium]